jgi:hypothetical protein
MKDKEEQQKIIFRLNALDNEIEIIPNYNFIYSKRTAEIYANGEHVISIRGWEILLESVDIILQAKLQLKYKMILLNG